MILFSAHLLAPDQAVGPIEISTRLLQFQPFWNGQNRLVMLVFFTLYFF